MDKQELTRCVRLLEEAYRIITYTQNIISYDRDTMVNLFNVIEQIRRYLK